MENKVSLMNVAVRNGIFLGLTSVLISVLVWLSGMSMVKQWWLAILVLIIGVVLSVIYMRAGVISFRNKGNEGLINFGQAFVIGIVIGLIGMLFNMIWGYLQFEVLDPEYVDRMIEEYLALVEGSGLPENMILTQVEQMEKLGDPINVLMQNLINGGVGSLIIALLVAAFIKKDTTESGLS